MYELDDSINKAKRSKKEEKIAITAVRQLEIGEKNNKKEVWSFPDSLNNSATPKKTSNGTTRTRYRNFLTESIEKQHFLGVH